MTTYAAVDYQVKGPVAWVRMNRPDALNAFNADLRQDLLAALQQADTDPQVRVIVLGSTGRAFCAGADLMEEKPAGHDVTNELMQEYFPLINTVRTSDKPVIGVTPGVAAGVGAALLMACDQVVMAEEARIYLAFSHIGLVPDGGATWLLYQNLGYQQAFELIVEGGSLGADACQRLGISNQVVAADQLDTVAGEIASRLAERSPLATAEAKKLLRAAASVSFEDNFVAEARAQKRCTNSDVSKEAIARFRDKAASK